MDPSYDIETVDRLLPQTQCAQCGYPRCLDYAQALTQGEAALNQCPPGGEVTIRNLAIVLGQTPRALDPDHGTHQPRTLAVIVEAECIGCTKCIQVCPVDAIVGAAKSMHIIISNLCTGCELCLPPCPMDCIKLLPYENKAEWHYSVWREYADEEVNRARTQTTRRLVRLQRKQAAGRKNKKNSRLTSKNSNDIRAEITAAVQRTRQKTS